MVCIVICSLIKHLSPNFFYSVYNQELVGPVVWGTGTPQDRDEVNRREI